ncbi:MAG: flagellar motor switch protein FliN [Abditibacteriales bacterium]|nr:flagellar motor switch protein FliN [Abditibacteriales bacterium]MDW8366756.1 flagellar motor switch protein FliN [Abditibacteriales bacterium]
MEQTSQVVNEAGTSPAVEEVVVERAQFQPLRGHAPVQPAGNMDLLMDVTVTAVVELGRSKMRIRDILQLGPGSIVELDRLAGEPVDLYVNDRLVAKGEVVVIDENFGFRVIQVVTREERAAPS